MAMSTQRCGLTVSSPLARMSSPSRKTRPGDARRRRQEPHERRGSPSSCRTPTRRRARAARPRSSSRPTPWTACSSRPPSRSNQTWRSSIWSSGDAHSDSSAPLSGRSRKRRTDRWPTRRRGLSASSIAMPIIVQARMTSVTQTPGGTIAHQASLRTASPVEGVLDQLPPGDERRVAEAEEGDVGLGEDRDRDREHRVGDEERHHLRQHVLADQPLVAGAQRTGARDVGSLADALRLGADEPGRARPVDEPDDEDDVGQAAAEERGDDDHQRDVGDHEDVVGDAHEHRVALAAVEARPEPDRPADEHGDERRCEADDERDARARDDEREHVRPTVVGAEPVGARRRLVDGAGLLPRVVRLEERREDRDEDEEDEDGEAEDHRRLPEGRGAEEAEPPRRDAADVGDGGLLVERGRGERRDAHASTTRGSSLT